MSLETRPWPNMAMISADVVAHFKERLTEGDNRQNCAVPYFWLGRDAEALESNQG